MISLKKAFFSFSLIFPFLSFSQEVIEEVIQIDTVNITYQVIQKETVGDYFQLKRYVFAADTSIVAIEKNFSNGNQNGLTRIYYPSGKLRIKALYGNNKLQGEFTNYNEDGVILTKGIFNYGKKHGFWAYKEAGVSGRYVKGEKHRVWKKKDRNGVKYKAWYWKGEFKKGADIFKEDYVEYGDTAYVAASSDSRGVEGSNNIIVALGVDQKYISIVKYLAGNYYLRKICKDYFRPTKKERKIFVDENVDYEKDVLKFQVASTIIPIDISYFNDQKKLFKPTLDSLIKASGETINQSLKSVEQQIENDLEKLSTDKQANLTLFFSKISNQLVVLEVLEKSKPDIRMKVLVLLDEDNEVKEVEYQKRDW